MSLLLSPADCVAGERDELTVSLLLSLADCVAGERDELTVSLVQEGGADCVAPLVHLQLTVSLEILTALTVAQQHGPHPLCSYAFFLRYSV